MLLFLHWYYKRYFPFEQLERKIISNSLLIKLFRKFVWLSLTVSYLFKVSDGSGLAAISAPSCLVSSEFK